MDTMIMKMPAVALRGMVILPGMVAHFDVSRAKSIKAVEEAMMDEQKIFLVAQKDVEQENPDIEDLFKIGIIAALPHGGRLWQGIKLHLFARGSLSEGAVCEADWGSRP